MAEVVEEIKADKTLIVLNKLLHKLDEFEQRLNCIEEKADYNRSKINQILGSVSGCGDLNYENWV